MGLDFDFVKGEGPAIENPMRLGRRRRSPDGRSSPDDARARARDDPPAARASSTDRVPAHRLRRRAVHAGRVRDRRRPVDDYLRTKAFMYAQPRAWHRLCALFADSMTDYLKAQVDAGAQALQIFDSWAGALGRDGLSRVRAAAHDAHLRRARAASACRSSISASATTAILPDLAEAGGDVIGVDWRQPLDEAWEIDRRRSRAIQGNLDPDAAARAARPPAGGGRRHPSRGPAAGPGTSSISATACCRRRRSRACRRSPITSTPARAPDFRTFSIHLPLRPFVHSLQHSALSIQHCLSVMSSSAAASAGLAAAFELVARGASRSSCSRRRRASAG